MIPHINILAQADAATTVIDAAPTSPAAVPAEAQASVTQPTPEPKADARPQAGLFDSSSIIMMLLLGVMFYFLLIRPQRKQQKEQKEREESLKEGSKVVTIGGMHGIVREVLNDTVKVELAPNVVVKFAKAAIAQVQSKK